MFRFNLQPLLNYRKSLEEKEQVALAVSKRQLEQAQSVLNGLKQREHDLTQEFRSMQENSTSTSQLSLYSGFLSKLERDIDAQQQNVKTARDTVEKKRSDLLSAVKKRKSLSKLKDSKMEAFKQEQKKEEQNFLNEVGINMFLRNTPE